MNRDVLILTLVVCLAVFCQILRAAEPQAEAGIRLEQGPLSICVTDNSSRLIAALDRTRSGFNGLASLIHGEQGKNIFVHAGLNYECGSTKPKTGTHQDRWNAPRLVPMTIDKAGDRAVRLTQKGADAAGVNIETVYTLGSGYVDMTVTFWPDRDVKFISTFWASYMNQVRNPSIYLPAKLAGDNELRWLEMTRVHQGGEDAHRPFDATGKTWDEFQSYDPDLCHRAGKPSPEENEKAKAALVAAGFKFGSKVSWGSFRNFLFGFVDDYVLLIVFKPCPDVGFYPTTYPAGGGAVRRPAWDFSVCTPKPVKAGEKTTFQVRLIYKPFAGLDDLMQEVDSFQSGG